MAESSMESVVIEMTDEGVQGVIKHLFCAYPSGVYPSNLGKEMDPYFLYRALPQETVTEYFRLVRLHNRGGTVTGAMLEVLRTEMGDLARRALPTQDPFRHVKQDTPGMQNLAAWMAAFEETFREPLTGSLYGRICCVGA